MLRQAVESNLDVIHGRLPSSLRPARRWTRDGLRWAARVAVPAAVVVIATGIGRSTTPGPNAGSTPPALRWGMAGVVPSSPAGVESDDVRAFAPSVLGLTVRRVVIDAGHGGSNRGTASPGGVEEKELTLDIAKRFRDVMAARGFETVMTRDADESVSLQQRAAMANGGRADIFVSIHLNWFTSPSARGIETYYLGPSSGTDLDEIAARENEHAGYSMADLRELLTRIYVDARRDESRRLATEVQAALLRHLRASKDVPIDRGVKRAPFVVLVATDMPAILAEVSCLSNADEVARLSRPEYRQRIADALASGIENFARARG